MIMNANKHDGDYECDNDSKHYGVMVIVNANDNNKYNNDDK
jgi:hypothetical protein